MELRCPRCTDAGVLVDLAVRDAVTREHREHLVDLPAGVDLGALDRDLVDVGHGTQQAERAGEEVEELHVLNCRVEQCRVHADRAIQEVGLEAEFGGLGDFLLESVVDVRQVELGRRVTGRRVDGAVRARGVVTEAERCGAGQRP
jgi:hypothetical protein